MPRRAHRGMMQHREDVVCRRFDLDEPRLRLGAALPAEAVQTIERKLQLHHCKWDLQVGDVRILMPQPLLMAQSVWDRLAAKAELAAQEIYGLEEVIVQSPALQRLIGVPRALQKLLKPGIPTHGLRTLRFDFHPTATGWTVSEVNADVPGGFGEASVLPALFAPFCDQGILRLPRPLTIWKAAVEREIDPGRVALLCAPGHLEDQQVVLAFGRELQAGGWTPHFIQSPAALCWRNGGACLAGNEAVRFPLVIRFYQAEWLAQLPKRTGWRELFANSSRTQVTNPLSSVISESKRLPLCFGKAGVATETLRELFPECRDPHQIRESLREDWVLKAAYANTGDEVHLGAELSPVRWKRLLRRARWNPAGWVAQRRFETVALPSVCRPVRPCVGVFVVGGQAAGAYIRLSQTQVTDASALEAPLLIVPDEDWK